MINYIHSACADRLFSDATHRLKLTLIITATALLGGCADLNGFLDGPAMKLDTVSQTPIAATRQAKKRAELTPLLPAPITAKATETVVQDRGVYTVPKTGSLVNEKLARRISRGRARPGDISLNFENVPIEEVARSVLGSTLNLNYSVSPSIKGTVTLRTSGPIARSAVLPTLEAVFRLNKAAIVEQSGLYRVIPEAEAFSGNIVPRLGRSAATRSRGFGVQAVPLNFLAAEKMAELLKPLTRTGAVLHVDSLRNMLLLAGTKQERLNLLEAVEIFDVDWLSGKAFKLIPLRYVPAETVVQELSAIFGDQAKGPLAGVVQFVPFERTNSILAISVNPSYLEKATTWIDKFDIGKDSNKPRLYVYKVQNGRAENLAEILSRIFGAPATAEPASGYGEIRPGYRAVELRSPDGSNVVGTGAATSSKSAQVAAVPSRPASEDGYTTDPTASGLSTSGGPQIIADDINNALLVRATANDYREVLAALRELDIVPLQVLIEATIAEVTLRDQLRYGVQWFFNDSNASVTLSEAATGAVASQFPGFSYVFSDSSDVRVVLNALEDVTDVKVLSAPQLMVLDNRTAELQVGDQVPVVTQSAVSVVDPQAPIVNAVELRDTGIVLRVTPRVNSSGLVSLEIEQESSDVVATTTSGIDSPTIQQRRINSSIVVQSGHTVALGGLITESRQKTGAGVPLLSRLPLVGALFGDKNSTFDRTELLVLITPRVVRNQEEARIVTEELRSRVKEVELLHAKNAEKAGK